MAETTTGSPWTDEDVDRAAEVLHARFCPYIDAGCLVADRIYAAHTHAVLDALAPRVAELQRAAYDRGYTHADNGMNPEYEIERGA